MRKRKFVAFLLCWGGATVLAGIALFKADDVVEALKVYTALIPWLIGVYGAANVAAKFTNGKEVK